MEFQDKVALITGAGSGIGRETALAFAKEGAKLVVADINEKGGQESVELLREMGAEAIFLNVNVADFDAVKSMVQNTVDHFGKLDIAINNAGIGGKPGRTVESSLENWDKVMAVNASGVFYCLKAEIEQMLKQGSGAIVNISSIAGLRGLPNSIAYTASKHAVIGMTKTAAMEYARKNIRINAVCPVFTVTNLFQPGFYDEISPGLSEKLRKTIPIKRFGKPEEIAQAILWLCSDRASFVTGHAMPVDGGQTA